DASILVVSVCLVVPSGVVTVVVFLTSAFFSHPVKAPVKVNAMQIAKNRFMLQTPGTTIMGARPDAASLVENDTCARRKRLRRRKIDVAPKGSANGETPAEASKMETNPLRDFRA